MVRLFRWPCACLLLALLVWPAQAVAIPRRGNQVHKEIEALENEWRTAQLTNDWKTMDRLLDDEYTGISTTGQIQTKEQAIAARKAGTLLITRLQFSDVKVRVQAGGTAAVVISRADVQGTNGGEDISGHYRYMRVYEKRLGEWHIVTFIATPIHDHMPR
jgi:ketosteroid isomerase-like protein